MTPVGSWLRRVVPDGYATAVLSLDGTSPLLMNSGEVDRDSETYRAYYMLGQKQRKSLDDEARLRELEWQLRLYLDPEIGPFIPGKNVKEMIRAAATKWRKGEEIKRSLAIVDYRIPLEYPGPRDQQGLWDAGYRYTTMVANAGPGGGRVVRCRPMFEGWSLRVDLAYDPEDLDPDFLAIVVERTQKYGLGDYRPSSGGDFGCFKATLLPGELHKPSVNGSAARAASDLAVGNHRAFRDKVMAK